MKLIIKYVSIKKATKNTYLFSVDVPLGGKVIKMAIICQRVVIWLHYCADMIAKALIFHLIPNLSHLKPMKLCYQVMITKTKILPAR